MSDDGYTEQMRAIVVVNHGRDEAEPPPGWVPVGSAPGVGMPPWEVEKLLRECGYDHRDVNHVLYVVPEADYRAAEADQHRRGNPSVVQVFSETFACEPADVQAVRKAAVDRPWEKPFED